MAKIDTNGIDAISPPRKEFFFAISETRTIIPEESKILIIIWIMIVEIFFQSVC